MTFKIKHAVCFYICIISGWWIYSTLSFWLECELCEWWQQWSSFSTSLLAYMSLLICCQRSGVHLHIIKTASVSTLYVWRHQTHPHTALQSIYFAVLSVLPMSSILTVEFKSITTIFKTDRFSMDSFISKSCSFSESC